MKKPRSVIVRLYLKLQEAVYLAEKADMDMSAESIRSVMDSVWYTMDTIEAEEINAEKKA